MWATTDYFCNNNNAIVFNVVSPEYEKQKMIFVMITISLLCLILSVDNVSDKRLFL